MSHGFQRTLDQIRSIADTEVQKGRLFERLMKTYFTEDPLYKERFSKVWRWSEWAQHQRGFDGADTGIDLVAEERAGGYCAIQCKCYAPGTQISKPHLDSFISASARDPFTARIVVDTGDEWGPNAVKTILPLKPACSVLRFGDLLSAPFDWPDLIRDEPEALSFRHEPYSLRPHQKAAFDDVSRGFEDHDRGKLIMACGAGKTFTALRLAEAVAGIGGRVLYLVPSISLFSQSMREWAMQQAIPHRYIGICSDTRAGRNDEDASIQELEIPVTTDPAAISEALRDARRDVMTVVFCTYHSLAIVARAQEDGAPEFYLIFCDEAHRTTGIERPGDKTSPFVLVHDAQRIRAAKRLYMTATPRLYTEVAKSKAASHDVEVFSMDDPATYGPEFHRLPFSRAVEQDLLSDYRVVVLAMSEQHVDAALQAHLATGDSEINITDAAKIVGCWRALQNPENKRPGDGPSPRLTRAIAFTNTIASSKRLVDHWDNIVGHAIELLPEADRSSTFRCETRHVDGQHHALDRRARIEWLKEGSDDACRILSNARCLSEGIDVPALDAVLFMSPRNSQVDIVQAVGRAMRKAPGKQYGYIVLPIAVPAGIDPAAALDDNERFAVVWSVLRALRSHDDRFDAEINKIDLNDTPTGRIIFGGDGTEVSDTPEIPFPPMDLPPGAIFAKIVEKCGDRKYWETWARDVADIFSRLVHRIEGLLANPDNATLREWFDAFQEELQGSINESIDRGNAIDMMAQHILTRPVFEALFEHYDFAAGNPVARALDALRQDFGEFGLENETRDLERFYESVRMRARGLDNSEARQRVLMELYEKFFATALKKDADRLGIVYTPVEIVDFILNSADYVLQQEFGRSLSDEGVHVLDPFTGTGIFLVRLLQSGLLRDGDLARKYHGELHANEIVLLAYYIAAIHIEEAFHGRCGPESDYEPFDGIVLTDTFNLHTDRTGFPKAWLPDNSERVERQQNLEIQVIVGNPPWSAGQRSSADDNPNVDYPELERRVSETYAARSNATLKNSLYDTYKMAIRWASDRIGEQGVVALVTNGSWVDGNVDSGVRACLAEEFSAIYVLNLRGNQRTQGERSRQEGGKVFGQGSRAPVAITILVRNSNAAHDGCRILYRDVGDYLKREEKLGFVRDARSIAGVADWAEITPDRHHDWIGQRSEGFQQLYPLGSKEAKAGRAEDTIFKLYSRGLATSRDAYIYNFSRDACAENARKMVDDYMGALQVLEETHKYRVDTSDITRRYEAVPSVVESRWRLLPGCGISRVLIRKERPPMKKPYTIVPDASTPSSRELADWLAKDGQLLVPLVELLEKGERAIDEVIDVMGRATVEAVLKMSAEQVAGPKEQGRRDADRELYWHGVQAGRVALKERQLRVAKPRLRKKRPRAGESGEVEIPAYTALQGNRRLADRMLELMLHGVSTRKYEPVLPAMAEQVGISKSEVSRETIEAGTRVLQELAERDLSELDVLVVYLDGIQFADYHVLAAVGVDADGRKHVLGLCGGASENTTVTISLLEDLVTRGLRADRRRLFVIDGAQALRKAIGQVFGSSHLVQRCRNHKLRNVLGHLPKEQQEQARSTLRAAWKLDAEEGIRKLEQYASWLEREWPSAAASLREGLAELFTVNRLGLPQSLRRCLTTTNIIDSSHAGVRQHTDRVSRWRNEEMAVRWAAVTFRETEKHYRRITGYEHLWMLKAHLDEEKDGVLAGMQKVG